MQVMLQNQTEFQKQQAADLEEQKEANSLSQLTTILSIALITILSLLTLSLYKNNNIRLKTNNMLHKKNEELIIAKDAYQDMETKLHDENTALTEKLQSSTQKCQDLEKALMHVQIDGDENLGNGQDGIHGYYAKQLDIATARYKELEESITLQEAQYNKASEYYTEQLQIADARYKELEEKFISKKNEFKGKTILEDSNKNEFARDND